MATLQELVAQVATAYFTNVSVSVADIPMAMSAITDALRAAEDPSPRRATEPGATPSVEGSREREPVEIERSITPDALISFEDGRPYKTLRRHLTARGLTPVEYRAKHGLPDDYPMVAQNTSAARSQLARDIGLGGRKRPPSPPPPAPEAPATGAPSDSAKTSRRGRAGKPAAPRRRRPPA